MKKTFWIVGIVLILVVLAMAYMYYVPKETGETTTPPLTTSDVRNISYTVNGETFLLVNGKAEILSAPGSASKNTLTMFGEPVFGDLNGDGVNDAAVLLVNEPAGSGSFFYAALAMNVNGTYVATESMLLGDRIAPQTVEIHDGRAVYNIAVRKGTDPMTTPPSIGQSIWVHYDPATNSIGQWVKDFEGESASSTTR